MATTLFDFGWDTIVVDGGWSDRIDGSGIQIANPAKFPDGIAATAAKVHALGLRFGVWTIRGIPAEAVAANLPIAGSLFHAADAARLDVNCSWDKDNVGVRSNAAGRAYYESVARAYATNGIDFVKIDCMVSDHDGLYTEDFTLFAEVFKAAGIEISVSPGTSMNPLNASYIVTQSLARHYRITNDMWDLWDDEGHTYPTGVKSKLTHLPPYAHLIGVNDVAPSPDMLPLGVVMHQNVSGGIYGPPSPTHLTRDEQITLMTLCVIARTPLLFGGRLPLEVGDTFTLGLMTNAEALTPHRASTHNAPIAASGGGEPHAWAARPVAPVEGAYVALFNAGNTNADVQISTTDAGFAAGVKVCARDLWARALLPSASSAGTFTARLPLHGAGLFHLTLAGAGGAC